MVINWVVLGIMVIRKGKWGNGAVMSNICYFLFRIVVLNIVDFKIDNLVFKCIIWVLKILEVWFISYFYFFY